jgi:hypothetical protein
MDDLSLSARAAVALLAVAARRWPAELRDREHRAWLAELHAITTDPGAGRRRRSWRALRFGASLAVRRPVPSALSAPPVVVSPRPALELFGAVLGVAIFGTLAAMLLVHLPAAVADRLPHPTPGDGVHRFPLLALVPVLAAVGILAGRRLARRDAPDGLARTVGVIVLGVCCARLFPIFGDIVPSLPGVAVWAAGLWVAAAVVTRLAGSPRGPLLWAAVTLGALVPAHLAVTSTVWLGLGHDEAPRAYAPAWFPGVLLDAAVGLPMGTTVGGESPVNLVLDAVEFLPHVLIVATAFTLAYVHTVAARAARDREPAPEPV